MKAVRTTALALCLLSSSAVVHAQSGEAVDPATVSPEGRMNMAVSSYVFDYLGSYGDLIAPEDILKLAVVAKLKVIAHTCDGFEVDEVRYRNVMNELVGPFIRAAPANESGGPSVNLPFSIVMSGYSMFIGGNLAVAAYDPAGMCALGAELRAQMDEEGGAALQIWKDPE